MPSDNAAVSPYGKLAWQRRRLSWLERVEQAEMIVRNSRESMLRDEADAGWREVKATRRELVQLLAEDDLVAAMAAEDRLCGLYRRVDALALQLRQHWELCGVAQNVYVAARSQLLSAIAGLARQVGEPEAATGADTAYR